MTNLMIRSVTLAICSIALIAAFSVTPVVAAGSDPGGGEANYGGMSQCSAYPPSSYPNRSETKATHAPKAKPACIRTRIANRVASLATGARRINVF